MNKETIKSERLGESFTHVKHDSGLDIFLYPMRKFSTAFAIFGTKYGSVDTVFKTSAENDFVTVPEGIAHYLEHKLFESDECNAFERFAQTGASCNAFTSFDVTAYHFLCADHFGENLRILLDFVQSPYFTDENVEKERGIISQEIKMYLDDPGFRVFFNGLTGVYHNNPVRIDIAGTVESIGQINKELLYRCYNTFYNLNNMCLSIAGSFDTNEALAICDELLKKSDNIALETIVPEEPADVAEKRVTQKMYCALPLFQLGFKMPASKGRDSIKKYYAYNVLLEAALGDFSPFYSRLYNSGLINDSFSSGVFKGRGFFLPMLSGDSKDPDTVADEAKKELERLKKEGIPRDVFDTVKKMTYGDIICGFNSVPGIGRGMMSSFMNDITIYDNIELIAQTSYEDVTNALNELDTENSCLSIIEPTEI